MKMAASFLRSMFTSQRYFRVSRPAILPCGQLFRKIFLPYVSVFFKKCACGMLRRGPVGCSIITGRKGEAMRIEHDGVC